MNQSGNREALNRRNLESVQRVNRAAFELRSEAIDLSYEAIGYYLDDDQKQYAELKKRGFPEGESIGFYVTEGMLDAPRRGKVAVRTYGVLLVAASVHEALGENEDKDPDIDDTQIGTIAGIPFSRLKVSIPVAEDNFVEDFTMPSLSDVDEVYLEYGLQDGSGSMRWAVNKTWMYEYTAAADQDEMTAFLDLAAIPESNDDELLDDEVLNITRALRNVINMRAIPQRFIEVGQAGVHDL